MTGWPDLDDHPAARALRADRSHALVALDYDGTLAPVVDDPARAWAMAGATHALTRLGTRIAIVTGRPATTAVHLGGLRGVPDLVVLGQYGAERWHDGSLVAAPEVTGVEVARQLLSDLPEGARLEDKGLALVVHTRTADEPEALLGSLRPRLLEVAVAAGLELHDGRLVLELRAPGFDKGTALRTLLEGADPPCCVVYAGDDLGDLPAFAAARAWDGPSLLVCSDSDEAPAELRRQADLVVDGPPGVVALLAALGPPGSP